jgi:hypothetical protein
LDDSTRARFSEQPSNRVAQRIGQNKVLGIAVGDRSLVVAEASRAGGPPRVTLAAAFAYPAGVGLDQPDALGQAFGQFLKDRGFAARQVVVGVPARWVLSKPKDVPPADPATVAEALRLQVEGEFTQELRDLSFDYAGETSPDESRTVLLMALQGKHLTQVKAVAEAAKLQLAAVTPVGCVLGAATAAAAGGPRQAMVVSVGPGGVELAAVDGPAAPRVLRHLGASMASPAMLAVELRRAAYGLGGAAAGGGAAEARAAGDGSASVGRVVSNGRAANGSAAAHEAPGYANGNGGVVGTAVVGTTLADGGTGGAGPATARRGGWQLVVWDAATLTDAARRALADAAGGRLETGDLAVLGVAPGVSAVAPELAGAAALAVAALGDDPLPADFLHSKLAPPAPSRIPRKAVLVSAAAAAVLLIAFAAWWNVHKLETELAELNEQQTKLAPEGKAADTFVKKVEFAQGWMQSRGRYIACWADLHAAIPGNSPQAYITSFTLRDKMDGTFRAKASDSKFGEAVRDQLRASKRFKDVKYQSERNEVGRNTEYQFTVQFTYVPEQ